MVYYQVVYRDLDLCVSCGECVSGCPAKCFSSLDPYLDNFDDCTACGFCTDVCTENAIEVEPVDGDDSNFSLCIGGDSE